MRRFGSRMAQIWGQIATIDIVKFDSSAGVDDTAPVYSELTATWAEDTIQQKVGPFEEIATKPVYVFNVQPQNGVLPNIKESHRVVFNGSQHKIISVNHSNGLLDEIQVITETGRI